MSYILDNPGGGNCGPFAVALGLIDAIQKEYHDKCSNERSFYGSFIGTSVSSILSLFSLKSFILFYMFMYVLYYYSLSYYNSIIYGMVSYPLYKNIILMIFKLIYRLITL